MKSLALAGTLLCLAATVGGFGCETGPKCSNYQGRLSGPAAVIDRPDTEVVTGLGNHTSDLAAKLKPEPKRDAKAESTGGWVAVCVYGWTSSKYRYQDSAERAGRSHECNNHICAHTTYIEWRR